MNIFYSPCGIFIALITFAQFIKPDDSVNAAKRLSHKPLHIDDHNLKLLCPPREWQSFNETLSKIVIPRVVGTPGHADVRQFIKDTMSTLKWHIETDPFKAATPNLGTLAFENIIATLNPESERHLVLACHFDSKYFPDQEFLGASDSAVPCAMLLDLATVMAPYLEQNRANSEVSLQLLFLDGEEAFLEWSAKDSIYGARHLAAKWEDEKKLDKIDLFVLLDLLGLPDPQFFSFFRNTEVWHEHLVDIEERLSNSGHLAKHGRGGVTGRRTANEYFQAQAIQSYIEDDHIPFMHRGVPILHVIPLPFPSEWHTMNDSPEAIDHNTTENLNKIFRVFVAEYLHLIV